MFIYAIKSIIYLSLMYVPYMLLLRKESFFRFNRMMLLVIMMLSLVLPLINIPAISWSGNTISRYLNPHVEVGIPFAVFGGEVGEMPEKSIDWWQVAYYIYIIGVVITIAVKIVDLMILSRRIHKGVLWTDRKDGAEIYCHADETAPFSWFRKIVISSSDYENNSKEILRHEMGHIKHGHSWDIVLLNVVQIIQWINPLAWIFGISLRDVHEYEADDAVLNSGVNIRQYQTLLIRKAIGMGAYSFANGFNHSLLTKRIKMMLRKKSNPWMRAKGLYVIVVACIALSALATPELNNKVNAFVENQSAASENNKGSVPTAQKPPLKKEAAKQAADSEELKIMDQKGDSKVIIIIDGKESDTEALENYDPEKIKSVTVLKGGEAVQAYGERAKKGVIVVTTVAGEQDDRVYDVVEQMPYFPGGVPGIIDYISKSMQYPDVAQRMGVQGRVIVSFVVEKDGSLGDVKIDRGIPKNLQRRENIRSNGAAQKLSEDEINQSLAELDQAECAMEEEALRVVRSMPKWTPGMQKGKAIRVHYNLPISFKLQ